MAEQSEHEASTTGQPVETPENAKRDSRGVPYGTGDENGQQTYVTGDEPTGDAQSTGGTYQESEDHVPDPTALTGTLETSGTGGGVHERLTGTTRVFGDVEDVAQRIESLINERTQSLKDEVRGMLLQQEASTRMANVPQQTVEDNGLPTHTGNVVAPHHDSGAAQDADRSANVGAGSPDDVSAGAEPVADPAGGDSYSQQNIAGARNPNEPLENAKRAEGEGSEEPGKGKDFEQAAKEYGDRVKDAVSGKTPAKKTTATRRNTRQNQQDKK